ncbi:MAG: cell division protein FtsZ, partial [Pseudomonadota bacterium]
RPGLINLDFADVRAVMDEMGKAMMGTGEAEGEDRAIQAAEKAIANPLLDEISLRGAKGVLINITGAHDLTLFELDEAANRIREEVDPDANIIVGSTLDTAMEGMMRVSVVATGIDATDVQAEMPVPRRSMAAPLPASFSTADAEAAREPTPMPEPAPAIMAEAAEEPSLFERMDVERTAAEDMAENIFPDDVPSASDDDLPPPAYRPEVAAFEPTPEPETFVAPRAPAPGTPSPEALARLRAATQKAAPARAPEPEMAQTGEKPRFGINSLINRMTGSSEAPAAETRPARQQPPVQARATAAPAPAPKPAEAVDPDQERIEIPAFLRRQAN